MKISASLLLLGFYLLAPTTTSAQDGRTLGRLFHTPRERALLDAPAGARQAAPPPTEAIHLDGVVLRSHGSDTVWLNGGAVRDPRRLRRIEADSVVLDTPDGPRRLEVGERIRVRVAAEPAP